MTELEIAELECLEAAATPGDWCTPFNDGAIAADAGTRAEKVQHLRRLVRNK